MVALLRLSNHGEYQTRPHPMAHIQFRPYIDWSIISSIAWSLQCSHTHTGSCRHRSLIDDTSMGLQLYRCHVSRDDRWTCPSLGQIHKYKTLYKDGHGVQLIALICLMRTGFGTLEVQNKNSRNDCDLLTAGRILAHNWISPYNTTRLRVRSPKHRCWFQSWWASSTQIYTRLINERVGTCAIALVGICHGSEQSLGQWVRWSAQTSWLDSQKNRATWCVV